MTGSLLKNVEMGSEIPRLIHLTYARKQLPEALARNVQRFQELNPDWAVRLYDDDDIRAYIGVHFGQAVLDLYSRIDPRYGPARADLFRYLLLYNEGGCYLDVKSGMLRPLGAVLQPEDRYLLAQWHNGPGGRNERAGLWPELGDIPGGEYQQWHIIAVPGHPFLRAVVLRVLGNIASYRPEKVGVGKWGVLRVTGPIAFTRAVHPIRSEHPHRFVDAERDLGLQYSICADQGNSNEHARFFPVHYSKLRHPVVRLGWRRRITWLGHRLGSRLSVLLQETFGEERVRPVVSLAKKMLRMGR